MKKITFFLCAVFLTMIGYAQGSETFANLTNATGDGNGTNSSYQEWTWTGDNGEEWTATDARTDQTIIDEAITVRDGELSTTIPGGIGDLTLTTKRVFSGGSGDITVSVNGTEVGTIPYDDTEQTNTISDIDVSDGATLLLETPGNGDRVAMDDLTWTEASGGDDDCAAADIPFTQDFEGVTPPDIPNCGSIETNVGGYNGDGWYTTNETDYGFSSNVLAHNWTSGGSPDLDDWYFTQGINLEAGVDYQISFRYGSNSTLEEKLKVTYGTSPESSAMSDPSNELIDLTFEMNGSEINEENFQVDQDGVYYFGFQIHSGDNMYYIYVDDITIDLAPTCLHPTDLAVDNITTEEADVFWNGGAADQTDWEVVVDTADFDPSEGTPIAVTDTTTTLTGMDSDTAYDVYVRAVCSEDDQSEWEGPLNFMTAISCQAPTELTVDTTTMDSADIHWTSGEEETDWEVLYGEAGFDINSAGTSIDVTDTLTTLNDLETSTIYDVYVRAVCSEDDKSSWVGPLSFSTTFEDGYCLPQGTNPDRYINNFSTTGGNENITNDDSGFSENGYGDFTSMTVGQAINETINFTVDIQGGTAGFRIWVDWDQDGQFDPEEEVAYQSNSYETSHSGSFTVPEDALEGTTRMRIVSHYLSTTGNVDPCEFDFSYGEFEDYTINVTASEDCNDPTDIVVDNITPPTADVSWTPGGDETQWEVLYGEEGFDTDTEGQNLMVNDGADTTLTDLTADTSYDVYVRAVCGDEEMSDWAGPETFIAESLNYCTPQTVDANSAPDRAEPDRNTNFTTTGGVTNFEDETVFEYDSDANTTVDNAAPNGYADLYDTYTIEQYNGESFEFSVDYKGNGVHYYIWIDFDQDGQFEDSDYSEANTNGERFFVESVPSPVNPTITGTITIPENIEAGDYRIRIRGINDISNLSDLPCDEINWGEARDYKLSVLDGDEPINECQSPADIVVDNITPPTADVSWTPGGDETQWEVLYGEEGFDTDTEGQNLMVNDGADTTLTDLTADTSYDVYVRAVCGDDEMSDWAGPESFTTSSSSDDCDLITTAFTESFDTEIPECWTVIDNDQQGESWEYYNVDDDSYSPHSGDGAARIKYESDAHDDYLISPNFTVTSGVTDQVSFYAGGTGSTFPESFDVKLSTTGNSVSDFTETLGSEETSDDTEFEEYTQYTYDLSAYDGENVYIAIVATSTNEFYLLVDDFSVNTATSSCEEPTDIAVDNITDTTADVTWLPGMDPGDTDGWEVAYGEEGFDPDTEGETILTDDPLTTLEDLDPGTEYDVYVRTVCNEDGEEYSDWEGPETFTTEEALCETPTDIVFTNNDNNSIDVSWTPGGDETQWEVLYGEEGFDTDTEGQSLMVNDGADTTLTDLTADTSYEVYVRAVCGDEEMSDWAGPEPFTTGQASCEVPVDIVFSNNDNNSIDVSWTPVGDETQWEVLYGESGFDPDNQGESVMVNDMPETTLDNLEADMEYDVYVRAICDEDSMSDWAGPETFLDVADKMFESFTYYPNPVEGQLTLKANTPIEHVTVYNLLGQKVISASPNTLQTQLGTEDLQAAVYLMKVEISGNSKTFRIVKK